MHSGAGLDAVDVDDAAAKRRKRRPGEPDEFAPALVVVVRLGLEHNKRQLGHVDHDDDARARRRHERHPPLLAAGR